MKKIPMELIEQANIYINAIAEVAHCNSFTSTATMYAKDYCRVREHDKFTEMCRKHGVKLADRFEFTHYAYEIAGRKMYGRRHL